MCKIVYRITPVSGRRTEWYISKRGDEKNLMLYWFDLVAKAKRLGILSRQGTTKDHNLYFHCTYASGEQRTFKFVK